MTKIEEKLLCRDSSPNENVESESFLLASSADDACYFSEPEGMNVFLCEKHPISQTSIKVSRKSTSDEESIQKSIIAEDTINRKLDENFRTITLLNKKVKKLKQWSDRLYLEAKKLQLENFTLKNKLVHFKQEKTAKVLMSIEKFQFLENLVDRKNKQMIGLWSVIQKLYDEKRKVNEQGCKIEQIAKKKGKTSVRVPISKNNMKSRSQWTTNWKEKMDQDFRAWRTHTEATRKKTFKENYNRRFGSRTQRVANKSLQKNQKRCTCNHVISSQLGAHVAKSKYADTSNNTRDSKVFDVLMEEVEVQELSKEPVKHNTSDCQNIGLLARFLGNVDSHCDAALWGLNKGGDYRK